MPADIKILTPQDIEPLRQQLDEIRRLLESSRKNFPADAPVMDLKMWEAKTGMRQKTALAMCNSGDLPAMKLGKKWYICIDKVQQMIEKIM
ncbi:MAG: helix-turn-helix domain-containing protein [Lewinellaceae bacterium]|nr:helix-turn-helix domain-containing protein [Phaeodactylibacter sp.]MCB9041271.1 helix-turn-helix domain-containing protein [Lewinellaceae bacterium]